MVANSLANLCDRFQQLASPLRIAGMGESGEPRILQIAIPIFNGITALDAIGPYNVLQFLPNVKIVFVSHSKGLYRDGVLAMEANASFDEVAIPNPPYVCVSRFVSLDDAPSTDLESKCDTIPFVSAGEQHTKCG